MVTGQHLYTFPPSFHDNGITYALALFTLLILASISLAQMIRTARCLQPARNGWNSPVTAARLIVALLYCTIFLGTFPDVVVLILWNEVADATMQGLAAMDRMFDASTLIPFSLAILISMRAESKIVGQILYTVAQVLDGDEPRTNLGPFPNQFKPQLLLVLMAAVVAGGIAYGKWAGAV